MKIAISMITGLTAILAIATNAKKNGKMVEIQGASGSGRMMGKSKKGMDKNRQCIPLRKVKPLVDTPAILLSTAQNRLIYDFFRKEYFDKVAPPLGPMQTVVYGSPAYGTTELRSLVANMLAPAFGVQEIDPNVLYGTAGVTAALHSLFMVLNQNQINKTAIIAAPFWPGFRWASELLIDNGKLVTFVPSDEATMQLELGDIQKAFADNPSARYLIICNPQNPLGILYNRNKLEEIYSYVLKEMPNVHIISDEMFAHSLIHGHKNEFASALSLDAYQGASDAEKQRVHVVWGFAKDFGLNGWKVGFIHSLNLAVKEAFNPSNPNFQSLSFVITPISALTNYYLVGLMNATVPAPTRPLWEKGMRRYQAKLTKSYQLVKDRLDYHNISYLSQNYGAQFFWINVSTSVEMIGSQVNFTCLLAQNGLALGCGQNYGALKDSGLYRVCYTCYEPDIVLEGIDILGQTIWEIEHANQQKKLRQLQQGIGGCEVVDLVYKDYVP